MRSGEKREPDLFSFITEYDYDKGYKTSGVALLTAASLTCPADAYLPSHDFYLQAIELFQANLCHYTCLQTVRRKGYKGQRC